MNKKLMLLFAVILGIGLKFELVAMDESTIDAVITVGEPGGEGSDGEGSYGMVDADQAHAEPAYDAAENAQNIKYLVDGCKKYLQSFDDDAIWDEYLIKYSGTNQDIYDYIKFENGDKIKKPTSSNKSYLGATVRKGIIWDETEMITALLRSAAVLTKQYSERDGNESKIKNVLADLARMANEGVAWYNFNKKGHQPKYFSYMSAAWLVQDLYSLTKNLRGDKKNSENLENQDKSVQTDDNKKSAQKISDFNKKLVTYILPSIESLMVVLRAYDSWCATRVNKQGDDKYTSKRIQVANLTYLCSAVLAASRILSEFIECESESLDQKLAVAKIIVCALLLIADGAGDRVDGSAVDNTDGDSSSASADNEDDQSDVVSDYSDGDGATDDAAAEDASQRSDSDDQHSETHSFTSRDDYQGEECEENIYSSQETEGGDDNVKDAQD